MERFIREVRDHEFPEAEVVYELLYLESEKQGGKRAERRLKGFAEGEGVLKGTLQKRYVPVHRLFQRTLDMTIPGRQRPKENLHRVRTKGEETFFEKLQEFLQKTER